MKKKFFSKLLTVVLAASMMLTLLPVSAMGWETYDAGDVDAYAASDTVAHRILHLDCGRKYFSAEWIKALINEMSAAGYTQLQLAFGNDGLRFLLDDMTFTANGTTYDHATVVSKVEAGNEAQNSSGDSRYLTEDQMDDIIAYAQNKGIEIVPLLNLPGHANAILDIADDMYNASGSNNTLDVANSDAAIEFGFAIFQKYVDYFADKGCKYFNFGADEYANDASGTFSFSHLNSMEYQTFVGFINKLAAYIEDAGMTPRSFNDGLYYNNQSADIDKAIQCCYWSSGWGSYPVASASTIADKGHDMINTHGDYYYVLNKDSVQNPEDTALNFKNTVFMGSTVSEPVGSMFCIWCDFPGTATETEVAEDIRVTLRKMAAAMKGTTEYSTDVVTGGFNADGTINTPSTTETPTIGTTNGTLNTTFAMDEEQTLTVGKEATWTTSDADVIALQDAEANGIATYGAPATLTATNVIATAIGTGTATIYATTADGTTYSSDVTVQAAETDTTTVDVNLKVNETKTITIDDHNYANNVDETDLVEAIATVDVTGQDEVEGGTTYTKVTSVTSGSAYYIKSSDDEWLTADAKWTDNINSAALWTVTRENNSYYLKNGSNYLAYTSGEKLHTTTIFSGISWSFSNGTFSRDYGMGNNRGNYSLGDPYSVTTTPATSASTTLTFTGVGEGTTSVTVGNTTYNIHVTAPTTTESKTLYFNKDFTPTGTDITITEGNDIVSLVDGQIVAGTKAGNATVTSVTKNAGGYVTKHYTYTIKVTEVDLSTVTPLTIEYWITNVKVTASGATQMTLKADAANVYSENGAAMSAIVPATGVNSNNDVGYWKSTRLPSDNKQTTYDGVDKTLEGDDFVYIRYWDSKWSFSADRTNWTYITATGNKDQLVAYYIQKQDVTKEIDTYFKDWGHAYGTNPYGSNSGYVALTVAVVYPDGNVSPTEANMVSSSTTIFNYWKNRNIGVVIPQNNSEYAVSKITVTNGTGTCDGWNNLSDDLKWEKKTLNDGETQWYDETVVWDKTYETDPIVDATNGTNKLIWSEKNTAKLILIYLEVEEKDTNLNVVWYDQTANKEITSMQVAMKYNTSEAEPTYTTALKNGSGNVIGETKDWSGTTGREDTYLPDNAYVTNAAGVDQTINKDLVTNTLVTGAYKSGIYKYNGAVISEDGKTLTLYYVLDSSRLSATYVIDFGLPIKINVSDIAQNVENVTWETEPTTGTVKYENGEITYTPTKTLSGLASLAFTFHFADSTTQTFRIGVLPASNVLYEESFFTAGDGWTLTANTINKTQEAQKTGDTSKTYNVFGYDDAYKSSIGKSDYYQVTGLQGSTRSAALKTSFYGNGFDLIGSCGADTGLVMVTVKSADGNKSKTALVDTRYNGGATFDQVPLAHIMLDEDATYNVTIRAYAPTDAATTVSTYSTYSYVETSEDAIYADLAAMGVDVDEVEFISMNEVLGGAAIGVATIDTESTTATTPTSYKAVIDGFRVYRSTDNTSYPDNEQGVEYWNILDLVKDEITAWTESDGNYAVSVETYESNGGPQNEIYLGEDQSVTFSVGSSKTTIQVSLRAVSGEVSWATSKGDGTTSTIASNTEMYYEVTSDADGTVTIANRSTGGALLAIGNVKLKNGTATQTASELPETAVYASVRAAFMAVDAPVVDDPVEDAPSFKPELKVSERVVNLFRSKLVTLTITTSLDVETLEVNGHYLRPTNAWMVKMGWADSYTYVYVDTLSRGETGEYQITAYDIDGNAYADFYRV